MKTELAELEALWASVEHWLDNWGIVVRTGSLPLDCIGGDACPLCRLHIRLPTFAYSDCSKCVIQRHTGEIECNATPWHKVSIAVHAMRNNEANADALEEAVLEEYQFLVDLALQESQAL